MILVCAANGSDKGPDAVGRMRQVLGERVVVGFPAVKLDAAVEALDIVVAVGDW